MKSFQLKGDGPGSESGDSTNDGVKRTSPSAVKDVGSICCGEGLRLSNCGSRMFELGSDSDVPKHALREEAAEVAGVIPFAVCERLDREARDAGVSFESLEGREVGGWKVMGLD